MNKEKDLIITLDNNKKYTLVSSLYFENKKYIYLIELENFKNFIIGEMDNDEIIVIEDKELFGKLIIEFSKGI